MPAGARRLISYGLSLALVIPLLVVATGGSVALMAYTNSRASIRAVTSELFGEVAEQTAEQTRALGLGKGS